MFWWKSMAPGGVLIEPIMTSAQFSSFRNWIDDWYRCSNIKCILKTYLWKRCSNEVPVTWDLKFFLNLFYLSIVSYSFILFPSWILWMTMTPVFNIQQAFSTSQAHHTHVFFFVTILPLIALSLKVYYWIVTRVLVICINLRQTATLLYFCFCTFSDCYCVFSRHLLTI